MRGSNPQPELLPFAGRFMTKIVAEREAAFSPFANVRRRPKFSWFPVVS
jgi:hypothetical protein